MCFDILYEFCLTYSPSYEEVSNVLPQVYRGFHVKYSLFLPDFNET